MIKQLYIAKPRGFCAGVVMAIKAVEDAAEMIKDSNNGELIVYHAIVHNNTVLKRLEKEHSAHFVENLAEVNALKEKTQNLSNTVVFSAHGVSPAVKTQAAELGLATIDATCPLVTKVHSEAKKYSQKGYHILLIGDSSQHQEVIGTYGEAPQSTTIVSTLGNNKKDPKLVDPHIVSVPNPEKVVVLTQTTLSVDETMKTIEILKQRFPKLVIPASDDLCYATKNRQDAVKNIGSKVDLFLVVTSDYSSNGMRLLELANRLTGNAKRVESVNDIKEKWLKGIESVGITSAASTPDDLVQEIVVFFRARNSKLRVIEEGEWENINFRRPRRIEAKAI